MDAATAFVCAADTATYHVGLFKEGGRFQVGIHHFPGSRAKCLQPASTGQNDLHALMYAVCGQSLAVEGDSVEASAHPRILDEPDWEALQRRRSRLTTSFILGGQLEAS